MRKSFLLLVFLFNAVCQGYSQLIDKREVVGQVKSMGAVQLLVDKQPNANDTTYRFIFRTWDDKKLIIIVPFSGDQKTPDELYEIMNEVFTDDAYEYKHHKRDILLGEAEVTISRKKLVGVPVIYFNTSKGSCHITKKQLEKLFGKDKEK